MHCMVDVAVRFSLRRKGRILMETMVVATRTLWPGNPSKAWPVPMKYGYEIAVATRDDIPGIVDLQGLDSCFGSNMDVVHGR